MEEPKFIRRIGKPINQAEEPTKESIAASLEKTTQEMITSVRSATYKIEDILEILEMSLIRRKQSLDEDRKALLEL